jgi:DNA-binding NarL/FixJ family response regulator
VSKNSAIKVLVVDDQPTIVEEVSEFLQSGGYECVRCCSSSEALGEFRNDTSIGIVVCDLDMPERDGFQLVEAMNQIAGKKRIFETIMLTRRADKQNVIKALRAGVADYYQKPLNLDELLDGVQRQESALQERQRTYRQLGNLDEKLQQLAASIDSLYEDLEKMRRPAPAPLHREEEQNSGLDISALFAPLSPRQQEVARLVATGQTNYQIGCELGITENTVKLYVSQVLRLTHMHNRTQLALALAPNVAHRHRVTAH